MPFAGIACAAKYKIQTDFTDYNSHRLVKDKARVPAAEAQHRQSAEVDRIVVDTLAPIVADTGGTGEVVD